MDITCLYGNNSCSQPPSLPLRWNKTVHSPFPPPQRPISVNPVFWWNYQLKKSTMLHLWTDPLSPIPFPPSLDTPLQVWTLSSPGLATSSLQVWTPHPSRYRHLTPVLYTLSLQVWPPHPSRSGHLTTPDLDICPSRFGQFILDTSFLHVSTLYPSRSWSPLSKSPSQTLE